MVRARRFIPIEDMRGFHIMLGVLIMGLILFGGFLALFAVGIPCRGAHDAQSCVAFDPVPVPGSNSRLCTCAGQITCWSGLLEVQLRGGKWGGLLPWDARGPWAT